MIIIGLTGQVATGKSTVLNIFKEKGFRVFNSDDYVNDLSKKKSIIKKIKKIFPNTVKGKYIDKEELRKVVFIDDNIKKLENIYHPLVKKKINKEILISHLLMKKGIVLELPLLFESNLDKICDIKISTIVKEDIQLKRILKRKISDKYGKELIKKQKYMYKNQDKCDFIINTDNKLIDISKKIDFILGEIKNVSK